MSLWHGMLSADPWGTLCGGAEGREHGEEFLLLALCTLVTQPRARTQPTALSHTTALAAECPSAKHSDWMLTQVLLRLQWAVATSQFCSPIPFQDLTTSSSKIDKDSPKALVIGRTGRGASAYDNGYVTALALSNN